MSGDITCKTFGTNYRPFDGPGIKYKVGSYDYDSSVYRDLACGDHYDALSFGVGYGSMQIGKDGYLSFPSSSKWPSIDSGGPVSIDFVIEIKLPKSNLIISKAISFRATTPCDCESLSLTTILDTSSTLTVIKE